MVNKSSNIKERVLQIAEFQGITKENFFEKIGMSYGNFKGKSKNTPLNSTALADIIAIVPEINTDWLLTGVGDMYKDENAENNITKSNKLIHAPKGKLPKRVANKDLIKFYDVDFAAGDLEFYEDNHTIKPAYEMDIPEFAGCTAFRTYSNSMEKLIHSGNILFGTNELSWRDGLEYGQVYGIVCHDRRKFLKYIRKSPTKEETHFLLRSENDSQYDDFDFPKDKIKSIWLIHGWLNNRV
jgi:phage repressor protein C with HTH and peptisase S24 domain